MRKPVFLGKIRYGGCILTFMQGILLVLTAIFLLGQAYSDVWQSYPDNYSDSYSDSYPDGHPVSYSDSCTDGSTDGAAQQEKGNVLTVYLKNVPEELQETAAGTLFELAARENLFLVRTDEVLLDDGSHGGWQIGIYGNPDAGEEKELYFPDCRFLDCEVLNGEKIRSLLTAEDPESTLGVDRGSASSVGNIPTFRFAGNAVVRKLLALIEKSGTVNGVYRFVGLSKDAQLQDVQQQKAKEILSTLSEVCQVTEESLTGESGGSVRDSGLMGMILLVFLCAQIFLNIVFFLLVVMKNLGKQGKLALLGWTPAAFAIVLLRGFLLFAAAEIPFLAVAGYLLSGWNVFSPMLAGIFLAAAAGNVVLTGAELFLAAVVILFTKPLDAIRGRIPKKRLYALAAAAYLAVSAGLVFCGVYVDQPARSLYENAKLSGRWSQVSGYQVLGSISVGEDGESFQGGSNRLDQDLWEWYSGIADQEGVYLIHTEYYDREVLNAWESSRTYASVPEEPLWLFTMSPNYLRQQNIELDGEELLAAEEGTRLYLLPADLKGEEAERMKKWLVERDTKSIGSGDIRTAFTREQKFAFAFYEPEQEMFTWSEEEESALTESAPVICVVTPENMKYTETEGLRVSGLSGYLKFADRQTAEMYTSPELLGKYHLSDNQPVFRSVQDYIDGIQKQLRTTILWFGGVFLVLTVILAGLLLTLAAVYRMANKEKIAVKKFLGYGTWQICRGPALLPGVVFLIQFLAVYAMESRAGVLLILFSAAVQDAIFAGYMSWMEEKQMIQYFKGV